MTGFQHVLVLGDAAQPSDLTAGVLRHAFGASAEVTGTDWSTGTAGFAEAALAAEHGGQAALPAGAEQALASATILVTHFFPVGRQIIDMAPRLLLLATLRHGEENIDRAYAESRGVAVINNPGREAEAVSDFVVASIIGQLRGITQAALALAGGRWSDPVLTAPHSRDVRTAAVGLVGFGHVGLLVARKLAGFRCELLVHDPFVAAGKVSSAGAVPVSLDDLLARSDVVSLHARLTGQSRHLIGARELSIMREGARLVNTARAELVDEQALIEALRSGHLGGAALDVFREEPLRPGHPLLGLANVTLTPHMAGSSADSQMVSVRLLAERLTAAMATPPS